MTNFDGQFQRITREETTATAGDTDPGTGNEGAVSYMGSPVPTRQDVDQPHEDVPWTLEELHPELQGILPPLRPATPVKTRLSKNWRAYSYQVTAYGQPFMVVQSNPTRTGLYVGSLMGANTSWFTVGDSPAALNGGQSVIVPASATFQLTYQSIPTQDEVFAQLNGSGAATYTLYVMEFFD